jgi:hypothetical protein
MISSDYSKVMDTQQAFTKWRSSYGDLICPTTRDAFEAGWNAKSEEIGQSNQGYCESSQSELLAALKALTDWCREHTSPLDENSPHTLLVDACTAIDKANARSDYWKAEHLAGNAEIDRLRQHNMQLLEACRRWISWCDDWHPGKPHPADDLEFAREAIEKATNARP